MRVWGGGGVRCGGVVGRGGEEGEEAGGREG